MKIEYLTKLKNYPYSDNLNNTNTFKNQGITLQEIISLENKWNRGIPFPQVLKELLFLAGDYCNVFDYGDFDSQNELQDFVREDLVEFEKIISRPFYVIDNNTGYNYLFIYLDEGDNPIIYVASPSQDSSKWIKPLSNYTIKSYSEYAINQIKSGANPY